MGYGNQIHSPITGGVQGRAVQQPQHPEIKEEELTDSLLRQPTVDNKHFRDLKEGELDDVTATRLLDLIGELFAEAEGVPLMPSRIGATLIADLLRAAATNPALKATLIRYGKHSLERKFGTADVRFLDIRDKKDVKELNALQWFTALSLEKMTVKASRLRADVAQWFDNARLGTALQYSSNPNDVADVFEMTAKNGRKTAVIKKIYDRLQKVRETNETLIGYIANPETAPTVQLRFFYRVVNSLEKGTQGVRQLQSELLDSSHGMEHACELLRTIDQISRDEVSEDEGLYSKAARDCARQLIGEFVALADHVKLIGNLLREYGTRSMKPVEDLINKKTETMTAGNMAILRESLPKIGPVAVYFGVRAWLDAGLTKRAGYVLKRVDSELRSTIKNEDAFGLFALLNNRWYPNTARGKAKKPNPDSKPQDKSVNSLPESSPPMQEKPTVNKDGERGSPGKVDQDIRVAQKATNQTLVQEKKDPDKLSEAKDPTRQEPETKVRRKGLSWWKRLFGDRSRRKMVDQRSRVDEPSQPKVRRRGIGFLFRVLNFFK